MGILETRAAITQGILSIPGVTGISIPPHSILKVYVEHAGIAEDLPDVLAGYEAQYIVTGKIEMLQRTGKVRPAPGGVSISHYNVTAGTLGKIVYDNYTGEPYILSNNHVLANYDTVQTRRAAIGDAIVQPGIYDGGTVAADQIASLYKWVTLDLNAMNIIDCALAKPLNTDDITDEILDIGKVTESIWEPADGLNVKKSGRTTEITSGQILDNHATIKVLNAKTNETATFMDQIITTPMASGGDSGSLLVSEEGNKAVGLLFAGSDSITAHNKISNILGYLPIRLTPIPSPPPEKKGISAGALIIGGTLLALAYAGTTTRTTSSRKTYK